MVGDTERYGNYLRDLGRLIRENALEARKKRDAATGEDSSFALGRLTAYHEVVSLMQQQAEAFAIDFGDICLADLEPESDLI